MPTAAEMRPWGDNDDPSEYLDAPSAWPHDESDCPACYAHEMWGWFAKRDLRAEPVGSPARRRWRGAARAAFRVAYPRRYRAVADHRRRVRHARKLIPDGFPAMEAAASDFLKRALPEARRQRLIHREPGGRQGWRSGPWPDYYSCWDIASGNLGTAFIEVLREVYPDRFSVPSEFPYKDPAKYVTAFLRAVIAHNIVGRGRLAVKSRQTRAVTYELDRVARAEEQRFGALWVVTDVDFENVGDEPVGPATLMTRGRARPEESVSRLMPEALWTSDHGYPMPGAKHQGLIYAEGTGPGHHWDVTRELNNDINRAVAALRIGMATTGRPMMVWTGEPTWIHVESPESNPQPGDIVESRWRRVAVVEPEHLDGLRAIATMLRRLESSGAKTVPSVVIAAWRFARSFRPASWQDTVLDLATALEACLGPTQKEEIGLTLRTRAAHLLVHDDSDQAEAIYTDVQDLYGLRSDVIHGNPKLRRTLPQLWEARGLDQVLDTDKLHVLMDRWREVVRRAIAARLLLADSSLGEPLWPAQGDTKVDRFLVRKDERDRWRERLAAGATEYGLPLLANPAPPLVDYLHND